MLDQFHFMTPLGLLLFPVFLLLGVWLYKRQLNRSYWSDVCDPELLPFLEQKQEKQQSLFLPISLTLAGLLLSIAAAQPVWKQQPQPVFKQSDALVIALDLSASMIADDLKPSRLQRARFKIEDILTRLPDTQVALLVYAADAYSVTPLTEDADTILAQLSAMSPEIMPKQGSRADRALLKADQLLTQAGIIQGNILLITDEVAPAQIAADATRLKSQGRQLSILGVGTEQGAPIKTENGLMKDPQGQTIIAKTRLSELEEAANLGGGYAALITANDQDLDFLLARLKTSEQAPAVLDEKIQRWVAEGPWFVLFALPLLLPLFRRGVLGLLLPMIFVVGAAYPERSEAGVWQDLWQTSDQQAQALYQAGQKNEAAQRFSNPRWKQLSHYDNGDYDEALSALETPETAADWYNQANVLVRKGLLDKALAAYEKALEAQPDFEDAQYNRDLIKQLLNQQKSSESSQGETEGDGETNENPAEDDRSNKGSEQNSDSQQTKSQNEQGNSSGQKSSEQTASEQDASDQSSQEAQRQSSAQSQDTNQPQSDQQKDNENGDQSEAQEEQLANRLKQQIDQEQKSEDHSEGHSEDHLKDSAAASAEEVSNQPEQSARHPLNEEDEARLRMLNRIEDDPAGLWRRKFLYQYRQQVEGQEAEEKTW